METARRYDVHEAEAHFSVILEQVAAGAEVVICESGEPVAKIIALRARGMRTGRGSLRGQIRVHAAFDALPGDTAEAYGTR
ncbi:type II toxin-antitoxin system prevent-host-death family antitoxin [Streptomyces sp. A0642]|uniref:type II toxin-antitoxin system Phd/YefM family antitoxin n=1 Tax=Streptomyces sp. A0642 TaxID=2563100 RepID=UPI0010A201AE|nr:type II toxin-antitoxin system prevent-host-death family antitoxin [Streptomyces sp. A0642]THA75019.1 type II toxin-antitoxin system prevent-host-death family antitoxin [Streptomyces sp. A0642]